MLGRIPEPRPEDSLLNLPTWLATLHVDAHDPVIVGQRSAPPTQFRINRLRVLVERVDPTVAGDDPVVPKTVPRIDPPTLFPRLSVEPDERQTASAVKALRPEPGLAAPQLRILLLERKPQPVAVAGEPEPPDQRVAVNTQITPFSRVFRVVLRQRDLPQRFAGGRIEHVTLDPFDHVNPVLGDHEVRPAGVGTGDVNLVVRRVERGVLV